MLRHFFHSRIFPLSFIFVPFFFGIEGANQTATQSLLINIAAKAGAKAGAELGLREAKESGARAGAMAGAEAGERAGAAAGVEAARKAATEVATKTLKEALQKLGTMNKSVGCKSSIFDYYINHYRPPVGRSPRSPPVISPAFNQSTNLSMYQTTNQKTSHQPENQRLRSSIHHCINNKSFLASST